MENFFVIYYRRTKSEHYGMLKNTLQKNATGQSPRMIFTFNTVMNGFISELEGGVLLLGRNCGGIQNKNKRSGRGIK